MEAKEDILETIRERKLQWFGHVGEMEDGRLSPKKIKSTLTERRKRRRPKLSWAVTVNEDMAGW